MARQFSLEATAQSLGSRHDVYKLLIDSSTWVRWTPFSSVTLVEPSPQGGEGVGAVRQTRFRAMTGREQIVALTPDRQFSYAYMKGVLTPYMRDYVATLELEDDGSGTVIHWRSTFTERFPGSGWVPRRVLGTFIQKCADGLAAAAVTQSVS
jgi:hypothetical protein